MRSTAATPIFYYHSVGGPGPQTLALDLFRQHLDYLEEEGYSTVRFRDLLTTTRPDGTEIPARAKCAVLTFDDGLLDNFENVLPELKKRGMTATFFVVPGFDGVTRYVNPVTQRWTEGAKPGYTIPFESMTTEHRRALVDAGMEIGCHSMTHRRMTRVPEAELDIEIVESKRLLEVELGTAVETFCYPFGRFNATVVRRVEQAGYLGAASTIPGYAKITETRRWRCRRFLVHNPHYFREILRGNAFSAAAFVRSAYAFKEWRFFQ